MTSTNLNCNWPESYWHVTRELMNDSKRFSERKRTTEILQILQDRLDRNKTKTMTFTEDGLMLAIKIIREKYGINS